MTPKLHTREKPQTRNEQVQHALILYRALDIVDAHFDSRMRKGLYRGQEALENAFFYRQWAGMRLILNACKKWPHLANSSWTNNVMMVFNGRAQLLREVFTSECLNDDHF